jgi:hypothetical protein
MGYNYFVYENFIFKPKLYLQVDYDLEDDEFNPK